MVCVSTPTSARDEAHLKFINEYIWEIVGTGRRRFLEHGGGVLIVWEEDFVGKAQPLTEESCRLSYLEAGTTEFHELNAWFRKHEVSWAVDCSGERVLLLVIKHAGSGFSAYRIEFAAAVTTYTEVSG
jgi:hypothetical protein